MAESLPTTGTATPIVELNAEQVNQSLNVSLADLCAKATAQFAQKHYEDAAELYAAAAEMQAEMNGEMSPDNAEILFLYGRALFKVGQSKSDVLGGKAAPAKPQKEKKAKAATATNGEADKSGAAAEEGAPAEKIIEKAVAAAAGETAAAQTEPQGEKKALFQFQGDENFLDSDEEEVDDGNGDEEEEEEDDLATAFEILDMARVLFKKQLETADAETEDGQGKGKEVSQGDSPSVKHTKERLGDIHAILTEVLLEDEKYPSAITEARESLKYKKELYPQESEIIAEAHFKLSLALEFASVTQTAEDAEAEGGDGGGGKKAMDQGLRDEAAAELEHAIASIQLKLQNKEVELATMHNPEDNEATRQQISEQKEILADMEQRLVDLRKDPLDVGAALEAATGGLFGGSGGLPQRPDLEAAKENATDLTGLVRKKRKAEEPEADAAEAKKAKSENGN